MHSDFFEGLANMSRERVEWSGEGFPHDQPIILQDREDDFDAFCLCFFRLEVGSFTLSEWLGILAISSKYCIEMGGGRYQCLERPSQRTLIK